MGEGRKDTCVKSLRQKEEEEAALPKNEKESAAAAGHVKEAPKKERN